MSDTQRLELHVHQWETVVDTQRKELHILLLDIQTLEPQNHLSDTQRLEHHIHLLDIRTLELQVPQRETVVDSCWLFPVAMVQVQRL